MATEPYSDNFTVPEPISITRGRTTTGIAVIEQASSGADVTAPSFGGVDSAVSLSPTSIAVGWSDAIDDVSDAAHIYYKVFVQRASFGPIYYGNPQRVTSGGELSAVISGLLPGTSYHVAVRAFDQAGNGETNTTVIDRSTTADTNPPTFSGAEGAVPTPTPGVLLFWGSASDDVSSQDNISFRVYRGITPGGENFGSIYHTSSPGERFWEDTSVSLGVTYYYVVRAVDQADNEDSNTSEVNATTAAVDTSPPSLSAISPTPGTPIAVTDSVSFSVTDGIGLRRAIVTVRQDGIGIEEVVYNGDGFVGFYAGASSLQTISGGYRFTVRRRGGWLGGPQFKLYAVDTSGNEAST